MQFIVRKASTIGQYELVNIVTLRQFKTLADLYEGCEMLINWEKHTILIYDK